MTNFLIVVDMQNDFIDGALGTKEAQAILSGVAERVSSFKGEVIFTKDTHFDNYLETSEGRKLPVKHCISGTHGHEIAKVLLPYAKTVIEKPTFGSFELANMLKARESEIGSVTLIGLCTDICVISNAMLIKAVLPEVEIAVESALCAGVTPESHNNALEAMKMCQINIK